MVMGVIFGFWLTSNAAAAGSQACGFAGRLEAWVDERLWFGEWVSAGGEGWAEVSVLPDWWFMRGPADPMGVGV